MDEKSSRKSKNRKNRNIFSSILTFIGVIGILVGGGILGTTLWKEYNRGLEKTLYLNEAKDIAQREKISREDFTPKDVDTVGVISIEKYDLAVAIKEGVTESSLFSAVGHISETHWPNDQKQIFLAGHRNTDFAVLEFIEVGDEIKMDMAYGNFTYKVTGTKIVNEKDTYVIDPVGEYEKDQLVLMTCYPFTFGAGTEERFLVYAEQV